MIEAPPLLTVKRTRLRPTEAQIAAFQDVPTGWVVDALFGGGDLARGIQVLGDTLGSAVSVAGPALTADNGAADVMAVFAALKFVEPGDVLVSAFAGHQGCAAAGDGLAGMAKNCGVAALVTDGPARDLAGIEAVGLPIWCTGLTPGSPHMSGPGTVGYPVQIGNRQVASGDMIVADRDGVVVAPFDRLDEIIDRIADIREAEAQQDARVNAGQKRPAWVDDLLDSDRTAFRD